MSKVVGLNGQAPPPALTGEPSEALIEMLEDTLEMARSGQLQSFIGTGFVKDGNRLAVWGPDHLNVYEMMGSLAWLQHEYAARVAGQ